MKKQQKQEPSWKRKQSGVSRQNKRRFKGQSEEYGDTIPLETERLPSTGSSDESPWDVSRENARNTQRFREIPIIVRSLLVQVFFFFLFFQQLACSDLIKKKQQQQKTTTTTTKLCVYRKEERRKETEDPSDLA